MRSARRMGLSRDTSAHDATSSLLLNTANRCGNDSTLGRTSRTFRPPHKIDDPGSHAPSDALILSTGNKMTMPNPSVNAKDG